jgi:predicted ArsR family transcriptional regulator
MSETFEENPTRRQIVMLLKKQKSMSVAEISRAISITPMAVRQHLISLEKRGMITYSPKKYGIGRPVFLYSLTSKALDIFPKAYADFVKEMLVLVEKSDGRKKIDRLFQMRKELQLQESIKAIEGRSSIDDKLSALMELLDEEGYMVEFENKDGAYVMKQFNCILPAIASDYPEACKYELQLYRELLGLQVTRIQCQADGDPTCIYNIPKD